MAREPVLECVGLRKSFGSTRAVDGVSFTVYEGECYGLLGPNGAGKTTTISIACGLLRADAGKVLLKGREFGVTTIELRSALGYVPQEIALYQELSPRDNLRFFGRLHGFRGRHLEQRIEEVLKVVGLSDRADDRVESFSGGMKRRANIAVALLHRPSLLVLDEPTVGVDPQSRNAILESVMALRDEGMAIIYTTHYMEEAARLCHRIGIIDRGRLIAEGSLHELLRRFTSGNLVRVEPADNLETVAKVCKELFGPENVRYHEPFLEVTCDSPKDAIRTIVEASYREGASLSSIEEVKPTLEDVFLALTGRELRD
jgi:ABC-2 type transport system ATP-binding protein